MEAALAGTSLASSIITFLDFSLKLVSGAIKIYRNENESLDNIICLQKVIDDLYQVSDAIGPDSGGSSPHHQALRRLGRDCRDLSERLVKILKRLKLPSHDSHQRSPIWKAGKSLTLAWHSLRKGPEVADIQQLLRHCQVEITLRLQAMMADEYSDIRQLLKTLATERHVLSPGGSQELNCQADDIIGKLASLKLEDSQGSPTTATNPKSDVISTSLVQVGTSLQVLGTNCTRVSLENRILQHLCTETHFRREDDIENAAASTYNWILEDTKKPADTYAANWLVAATTSSGKRKRSPILDNDDEGQTSTSQRLKITQNEGESEPNVSRPLQSREFYTQARPRARSSFLSWLKGDGSEFHVSGKPGAGKSTLMKAIFHHNTTTTALREWSGEKTLIMANFFFWSSGSRIQRSLEGFYTCLLFECLRRCPELIHAVFAEQWDLLSKSPSCTAVEGTHFRFAHLENAFKELMLKNIPSLARYRICLFIDGLDEYEGDSLDHLALAQNIRDWAYHPDIKICVSSRPHNEFKYTFSANRRIELSDLNALDIFDFTTDMFARNVNAQRSQNWDQELIHEIVKDAEGVFLWARLIVRSLLAGLGQSDEKVDLWRKLKAYPKDLDRLYDKLLNSGDQSDREQTDHLLQLVAANPFDFPMSSIAVACVKNGGLRGMLAHLEDDAFIRKQLEWSEDQDRQLNGLSKGLIHILPGLKVGSSSFWNRGGESVAHRIAFFHRTARDYVLGKRNLSVGNMSASEENYLLRLFESAIIAFRGAAASRSSPGKLFLSNVVEMFAECASDVGRRQFSTPFIEALRQMINILQVGPVYMYVSPGWSLYKSHERHGEALDDRLSLVHFLAYHDQSDYIAQVPLAEIPRPNRASILLSAIFSPCKGHSMVLSDMLARGISCSERVACLDVKGNVVQRSVWMIFVLHWVIYFEDEDLASRCREVRLTRALLLFLQHHAEQDLVFELTHTRGGGSYFTTLKELVRFHVPVLNDRSRILEQLGYPEDDQGLDVDVPGQTPPAWFSSVGEKSSYTFVASQSLMDYRVARVHSPNEMIESFQETIFRVW